VWLPKLDLVLLGYHLDRTNRIPLYDVAANAWRTADVPGSEFFARGDAGGTSVDLGLRYDASRELVWGVMCNLRPGAVQVLRVSQQLELSPLQ